MINKTSGLNTKSDRNKPSIFELGKAFPNPFNNNLTIPIAAETGQSLTIDIIDILGKQVELLVANRTIKGKFSLQWNATNTPTGTYFIRAASNQHIQIQKISLVK